MKNLIPFLILNFCLLTFFCLAQKTYTPGKDSILLPKTVLAGKPKIITVGKAQAVRTNINVHLALAPKIIPIVNPRVMGQGTSPKVIVAKDSSFIPHQPRPLSALPLRMKDNINCMMRYLDVEQGMSSSYVWALLKDKRGSLWFGTNGSGVSKYDGKSFTHYTEKEGLSSNNVLSILEDKNGNLWFATNGGGVNKYDGKTFTRYTEKDGLGSNTVLSILEDKNGNLWFGSHGGGVSKYNGNCVDDIINATNLYQHNQLDLKNKKNLVKSFTHYTEKEGLSNSNVWSIIEDKNSNLWFGTDGGVSMYNGIVFTNYTEKEGLSNNHIRSILEDKSGNLWFGTNGGGVNKYNGKSFTHYTEKEGLSNNNVRSILEDKSGNLWFGTYGGGVNKYDGNSVDDIINGTNLYQHNQQKLKSKKDLVKSFTHYTEKEGLSNNVVLGIIEDKGGNLWFATDGGGMSMYNEKSFTNYTEKEGLNNSLVMSILEDKSGNLWFGTYGGGVNKYNGYNVDDILNGTNLYQHNQQDLKKNKKDLVKSYSYYTDKEGLCNNYIRCILEDKNGNLWFGSNGGGVSKYNGNSFANYTKKEGLCSNGVLCMLEDKIGNLWFGTVNNGVSMYNGKTFTHYTNKEGLSGNHIQCILEDKKGNLWFGTYGGGVSKYNGTSFTHYKEEDGLCSNNIQCILEDRKGNLWFGSHTGGMSKYNGASFTNYTEKDGLSNNMVWSILEDRNTSDNTTAFWISTEKGLNYFVMAHESAEEKGKQPKIIIYHKDDGLITEDFILGASYIDSKRHAWWGSGKALTSLNLNTFKPNEQAPTIQLNNIYLQGNFIDYRHFKDTIQDSLNSNVNNELKNAHFGSVANFANYPKDLELPHYLNHLTFNFSAIDWAAPNKLQYRYKLEGLDKNWSEISKDNEADYRNMPFGTFTFKVKAIGEAGVWSEVFEYKFTILPPWWHKWWAYTLYMVCFVMVIYFIVQWNSRKLKARAVFLTQKIDEATLEIKEQKKQVEEQKYLIEERHKEITDSINYAERIQRSFLATKEMLDNHLEDYFVFFKPKDVVSGDFYWAATVSEHNQTAIEYSGNNRPPFIFCAADSTGHGVPGAIMSLLNITSLEKAVEKYSMPSEILNDTRKTIIKRLKKDGSVEGGKDGMDCSLCMYDFANMKLYIAAANNPVWIVRVSSDKNLVDSKNKEFEKEVNSLPITNIYSLIEIKSDKMPVGKHDKQDVPFTLHEIDLQKGDIVYTLTDGFPDQFGGKQGKKFMIKNLRELLLANAHLPMAEQKQVLETTFVNWIGDLEQVDDVTIIGVRI